MPLSAPPLVSCIMPTCNRRAFVPRAIAYFLRQDHANRELLVVDDGADAVADLVPADPRVRYLRLPGPRSLGAKRNECVAAARGSLIAHWDDDDWYAPDRLARQVEFLLRHGLDVCGLHDLLFYDVRSGQAWRYTYPPSPPVWLSGNTLCYRRDFWARNPFRDVSVGEDAYFVWGAAPGQAAAVAGPPFHLGIIHDGNASPKQTDAPPWRPCPVEEVRCLVGADWVFYAPAGPHDVRQPAPAATAPERTVPMFTVARTADLALPEFAAFNHGQALPWMRRWELPFALFQARLPNTGALLDCTINPAGFAERLVRLYPHVLYRHCPAIQGGRFVPPLGVPDEGFDRVVCVNTLEHLLRPQREALVAALARKLKPGGLLVLTSDYYFDSAWEQPVFLNAGVMRADRAEVFNGWNKVTPREWLELGRPHDLHPLAAACAEPREDDPALYRNPEPYPHACVAGVFSKTPHAALPAGKKVVLALLTWNTCAVSVDSVRAYAREARLLRRLGQLPSLCVCDNGSTDGTPEALRALAAEIDVPYQLICNPTNRGNSVARNQILDQVRATGADYVLFMDGDIEVVPFSSFAMLRHMENSGRRLGCVGADSAWQTPHRERAAPYLYSIDGPAVATTDLVAWTQYGLFRREVFEDGVRFDESPPFDGAGWGFEDNDLAFQMDTRGYVNQRFYGMTYLHRAARSSLRILRQSGIDAAALYARRKQYVIDKWSAHPTIGSGPLVFVRQVMMPD